jgi:hypothetical protein
MYSDFHEPQQQNFVSDMKQDGENPSYMSSEEIMVGSKEIMTHAQRQAFLKTSDLGKLLGVAHLLPDIIEVTDERSENLPHLKEVFLDFVTTEALKNHTLQPYTTEMSEAAHSLVQGVELDDQ